MHAELKCKGVLMGEKVLPAVLAESIQKSVC